MRFAYSVNQKIRIAMLLFAVMACSILIRILEDKSVENMNQSFVSMYNDRLIPATDLFYISDYIQQKSGLIEESLYPGEGRLAENIQKNLLVLNGAVDSLLNKYEKTFLVTQEKQQLAELKRRLTQSAVLEAHIVELILDKEEGAAKKAYELSGRKAAKNAIAQVVVLMRTQQSVGQELLKDSEFMVSGSKLYSTLQLSLAILIGVLIVGIVFSSNLVKISNEKFHLN